MGSNIQSVLHSYIQDCIYISCFSILRQLWSVQRSLPRHAVVSLISHQPCTDKSRLL